MMESFKAAISDALSSSIQSTENLLLKQRKKNFTFTSILQESDSLIR